MANTTVAIDKSYTPKLEALAKEYTGNNKGKLVEAMIEYFDFYQINPNERNVNLDSKLADVKEQIKEVRNTIVSFFRRQEKEKLEPLIKQSNESTQALLLFLKEQALTKDDLKNLGSFTTRKVATLSNDDKKSEQSNSKFQEKTIQPDDISKYNEKARESLKLYKSYFDVLIKSVSRSNDKGDFILTATINEFKEKIKNIPKVNFEGQNTEESFNTIERIETILRTVDNYCDDFLSQGQMGTGKDKLFYTHTIREFQAKFENIKI